MQKCYYHGKVEAATLCTGCKLPICAECQTGERGVCASCIGKRIPIAERRGGLKPQGEADAASQRSHTGGLRGPGERSAPEGPAESVAPAPRRAPTGGLNAHAAKGEERKTDRGPRCVQHADTLAAGPCSACRRAYCPACLNSAGVCSPCATAAGASAERMLASGENTSGLALHLPGANEARRRRIGVVAAVACVVLVLVMVAGLSMLRKPPARVLDETSATLAKLRENELSADEERTLKNLLGTSSRPVRRHVAEVVPAPEAPEVADPAAAPVVDRPASVKLRWVSPAAGATITGVTLVRAEVVGAVRRVDLLVDGEWQGAVDQAPYAIEWASQAVGNGRHLLTLEAVDAEGGKASAGVSVKVAN